MLKRLQIGDKVAQLPIIQGGMAVRISTSRLAAAVANAGGIGIIAGTGMSVAELREEIKKARQLTDGIIGVNVLFAAKQFTELVRGAMDEGIDLIISGAGFSRDMFKWGKETNTPIVPVVSSAQFAKLAERMGAAAIVVEGKEAGGHLGTDEPMKKILKEVCEVVNIPVIGAGGVITGHDVIDVLNMGAHGVQMGTRFAASVESNASAEMKELFVNSTQREVIQINSPVGYPGQGMRNDYGELILNEETDRVKRCRVCLKKCLHRDSKFQESFCILEALENACTDGDFNKALCFSGDNVHRIHEILPVNEIFRRLQAEMEEAMLAKA